MVFLESSLFYCAQRKGEEMRPRTEDFIVYRGLDDPQYRFDKGVLELINKILKLNLKFAHISNGRYPDMELGHRPKWYSDIAGKHVIMFSCPTTDRLMLEMQDMISACKQQYGARTLTLGMSFLRYRRQDRSDKKHEITRLRWFIRDLKHWGVDHLVLCEPHNIPNTKRYCREFKLPVTIVDPTELLAEAMNPLLQTIGRGNFLVYAPDLGSAGRAIAFARAVGTSVIILPKKRLFGDTVDTQITFNPSSFLQSIHKLYGTDVPVSCTITDVCGRHVMIREDELSTGSTAMSTANKLRDAGALGVYLIATHQVCTSGWNFKIELESDFAPFDNVWLGNTRPRGEEGGYRESTGGEIDHVDLAPAFARGMIAAIQKIVKQRR
ncbi:MAG: Ribose-phosphate pyrophosphokinase [Parcubacteria group bacterium Gr01-1014_48]|nr:MAG: Ribose-phosphate pyrophosphokinase [Parcubacteria group bacterium Greene0416_14]TSC73626.1 MAG: Ribose-phosphate pyrophosphokinase [Parcubacteria group bacterium Gr01-1014_48]TSD00904.1 MAG: Ribose-phosphate pyrophosphokinase [Parcubacteria group bacterium Greene1014_15]TSD07986.1 MAG: Ribose-phosphate pyrophosphokinase [Parcubacteria group bacterium Greene0714_4]